jgi:hypothetical protein
MNRRLELVSQMQNETMCLLSVVQICSESALNIRITQIIIVAPEKYLPFNREDGTFCFVILP